MSAHDSKLAERGAPSYVWRAGQERRLQMVRRWAPLGDKRVLDVGCGWGELTRLIAPGGFGVRFDSHIHAGYVISPYYDSLIAKLIVHGKDRKEAIDRLARALDEFVIEGIKTTIPFHKYVIRTKEFISGKFDTNFIEKIYKKELLYFEKELSVLFSFMLKISILFF